MSFWLAEAFWSKGNVINPYQIACNQKMTISTSLQKLT